MLYRSTDHLCRAGAPVKNLSHSASFHRCMDDAPSNAGTKQMGERGATANIKPMPNRLRHPAFSASLYKLRNAVERFFSKIKHYRAIATRYEKHPENYLALIKLAAARIWMRFMSR